MLIKTEICLFFVVVYMAVIITGGLKIMIIYIPVTFQKE